MSRSVSACFAIPAYFPSCRVNFIHTGELLRVGLSTLPGCKIKDSKRSVSADLKTLKDSGVTDLFVFSTEAELAT